MTGLIYLSICFLCFVCVGLDIAMFFLQIRLILQLKRISWLVPFDDTGKSLVNTIIAKIPIYLRTQNPLSEKGKLIIALVVFAIARIILGSVLTVVK